MLKWKIAAVLGLGFGVAGFGWGYAQQRQAPGFYERRGYRNFGEIPCNRPNTSRIFFRKELI